MNARLRDQGPFKQIWVQPAAGDAGTRWERPWQLTATKEAGADQYTMEHAFLGPEYSEQEIEEFLRWSKLPFRRAGECGRRGRPTAGDDKVIGWFQGRMEFGPRALGARSILASPLKAEMQDRLNEIKDREDFRPVAPVVLEEEAGNWFKERWKLFTLSCCLSLMCWKTKPAKSLPSGT
jgi:carbamoyltransferase